MQFIMKQLRQWEDDPMLHTCKKHTLEKQMIQRSKAFPPIPDIKVLEPQRKKADKKKPAPCLYTPKHPLSPFSVHYKETGTCTERYWANTKRLREEQIHYAIHHRTHHTGYGRNPARAKPRCVFPSRLLSAPPSSRMTQKSPVQLPHRCHTASSHRPASAAAKRPSPHLNSR